MAKNLHKNLIARPQVDYSFWIALRAFDLYWGESYENSRIHTAKSSQGLPGSSRLAARSGKYGHLPKKKRFAKRKFLEKVDRSKDPMKFNDQRL